MEVKVIGQMDNTIDHTFESANRVYDVGGVSPTINTCGGGGLQPKILENIPCATSRVNKGEFVSSQDLKLINVGQEEAGTILSRYWKGIEGDHSNAIIVAMRGRNPDNPRDRTVGTPTEQRLEPNSQGLCNTLTSVQKDNLVMEKVVIDDTYANRQPRVYEDYSPALRSEREGLKTIEQDICRIETYSPYVNQKYKEFQEKNGYIPEYFNPYNKTELTDVAPTLTAQGESITKSSTILKCDTQYRIRKLTPLECWRLMDFTDEDYEKAAQVNSNTQLYKQAGNSIVKNVLVAILGQMIPGKEDVYRKLETR